MGCDKEKLKSSDYLIFGSFYGMCQGEQCVETFKLTKDFLYEDRKDEYPDRTNFFDGDFEKLDKKFLDDALMTSIAGISAAMKNTG